MKIVCFYGQRHVKLWLKITVLFLTLTGIGAAITHTAFMVGHSYVHSTFRIGIDPGHGGIDSGTLFGSLKEKDFNLVFAKKLAARFAAAGFQTTLSRNEDQLLSPLARYENRGQPYKRDDLQRRLEVLQAAQVVAIISVHTNWSRYRFRRGPSVFASPHSRVSGLLAGAIQGQLNEVQPYTKLPKTASYYILRQAKVPIVLVEIGYISNPDDRYLLQCQNYQEQLCDAIIRGFQAAIPILQASN